MDEERVDFSKFSPAPHNVPEPGGLPHPEVVPPDAILEEGIAEIVIARSTVFNMTYHPLKGWAKWFRDELGQVWVKFNVRGATSEQAVQHWVYPADRVVGVRYLHKEP